MNPPAGALESLLVRPPTTYDVPFTIFIDGECPLCRREAALLRRLDRGRGRLILRDLSAPGFDPAPLGVTADDLMASIHGLTADGRVVTGMEVFRRAYAAIGWGFLLAPTAWPLLRPLADRAYAWFARNRLRLTRRSACAGGRCASRLTPQARA